MSASQFHRSTLARTIEDSNFVYWLGACSLTADKLGLRPYGFYFDSTCADEWRDLFDAGLTPYEADMRMFRSLH